MAKVKLINKGSRTITGKDGEGKPYAFPAGGVVKLDGGVAKRLLRLFPDEIFDLEKITKDFEDEGEAEEEGGAETWADSTAKEITAFLDSLEIATHSTHNKAALATLADAVEGNEGVNLKDLTIKDLQKFLEANEVEFESDANEDRLVEQATAFIAEKTAE